MFNRERIEKLEAKVREYEYEIRWIKEQLNGFYYSVPPDANTQNLASLMGYPAPLVQKKAVGLIQFRDALLKKLGLKFVEKPASMELEDV